MHFKSCEHNTKRKNILLSAPSNRTMSPTAALITLQTATTVRSIKGSGIETTVVIFRTATFIKVYVQQILSVLSESKLQ